ncbi:MAG TPA: hypothetical protein VM238_16855 [Phycisphaerae bacterium]|nr:hypothetical protein [Phycisphaerae bacterium]
MGKLVGIAFLLALWPASLLAQSVAWHWEDVGSPTPKAVKLQHAATVDGARFLHSAPPSDDKVKAIAQMHNGAMVFGARSGLYILKERVLERFMGTRYARGGDRHLAGNSPLSPGGVQALAVGEDGALWVGTGSGLFRISGGKWTLLKARSPVPTGGSSFLGLARELSDIQELLLRSDGKIIAGSRCAGVTLIDPALRTARTVFHNEDENNWVEGIAEDRSRVLWVGVKGLGVLRYDGQVTNLYKHEPWIPGADIRAICVDRSGALWVASHQGLGVRSAAGTSRVFTTPFPLPDNNVWNLCVRRNGQVWANTSMGLVVFDGQEWFCAKADGLPRCCCGGPLFEAADGSFWVGGHPGVVRNPTFSMTKLQPQRDGVQRERVPRDP